MNLIPRIPQAILGQRGMAGNRSHARPARRTPAHRATNTSTAFLLSTLLCLCLVGSTIHLPGSAMAAATQAGQNNGPLRIVMSAAFVADSGIDIYAQISRYLENKLDRKIEFVTGFSYDTINQMLTSGLADIGFVCGLPYILEHDLAQPHVELLLAPVMKDSRYQNKPIYFSYIIVHKDSTINSFAELKGKRFVFNDEISNSGYNMPRAHLIKTGETGGFFSQTLRSGSHEESIRMVALGKADTSAIDSLVYDYEIFRQQEHAQKTRIIKTLGPAGIPPIVVSSKVPLVLRQKIRAVFLDMNNDPAGRKILESALLDRFANVDDSNYDGIRKMYTLAQDTGYMVIK